VVRWFGGSVVRWFGGLVVWWFGGSVVWWFGGAALFSDKSVIRLKRMNKVNSVRELEIYQAAFKLQQEIFMHTKGFPKEERYSLTDQIRRSSRSVGANLSEAWAKRRYPAHFLTKLTDSDGELQETLHWLASAKACEYLCAEEFSDLHEQAIVIGRQLGSMMNCHESFCF
jgi:four helix bundle protein